MINYSIVMRRKNVADKESEKLAYATAQYNSVMTIDKFAAHIASHGCVYSRADIAAVLTLAVDCLYEQLLAGQKIELGDLGAFCISLNCKGADSAEEFN
ncbi:MAG: DNA-binding protein, partial [Bacteroidaceae bacterium]|nr:DNA-binding protein [Bacteroidaceae bacterium]